MTRADRPACRMLLEQLSAYLDGDLSAAECATIKRHSQGCRRCADVIADFRKTTGVCRRAAAQPLPAAVKRRAQARIRALLAE
jgi:anti-sigma factor RsiW